VFGGARAGKMREGEKARAAKEKYCHKMIHQHLTRDHHPKIAFMALRTAAVIERTLLDLLSDAEERMNLARSAEAAAVEVLAETINENHPASPRYQAGLRDDFRKGGRSITVTEFTFSILARTNSLPTARGIDLGARISGEVESIFTVRSFVVA
jgi:hypothetical protein